MIEVCWNPLLPSHCCRGLNLVYTLFQVLWEADDKMELDLARLEGKSVKDKWERGRGVGRGFRLWWDSDPSESRESRKEDWVRRASEKKERRTLEYSAGLRKAKGEFPSKEIHERSPAWGINGLALVPLPCAVSVWEHPSGSMVSECMTWLIWWSKSQCLSANDAAHTWSSEKVTCVAYLHWC